MKYYTNIESMAKELAIPTRQRGYKDNPPG